MQIERPSLSIPIVTFLPAGGSSATMWLVGLKGVLGFAVPVIGLIFSYLLYRRQIKKYDLQDRRIELEIKLLNKKLEVREDEKPTA